MPFSYGDAIQRITNQPEQVWPPGITASEQLQRINGVLDRVWTRGQFDGLLKEVDGLTTSGGILTLPSQFKLLTGLQALYPNTSGSSNLNGGCSRVDIRSQQWKFSPSAPQGPCSTWNNGRWYAFDQGDTATVGTYLVVTDTATGSLVQIFVQNGVLGVESAPAGSTPTTGITVQDSVTGQFYNIIVQNDIIGLATATPTSSGSNRTYQISGIPSYVDTFTFNGMAKLRYVYASNLNQLVAPDCFEGLLMGVRAFSWYDKGDTSRAEEEFATAMAIYEADLGQVLQDEDMGYVTVDYAESGGSILNLY
jgi:hypothetical protein